jgi:hypothetical protein
MRNPKTIGFVFQHFGGISPAHINLQTAPVAMDIATHTIVNVAHGLL